MKEMLQSFLNFFLNMWISIAKEYIELNVLESCLKQKNRLRFEYIYGQYIRVRIGKIRMQSKIIGIIMVYLSEVRSNFTKFLVIWKVIFNLPKFRFVRLSLAPLPIYAVEWMRISFFFYDFDIMFFLKMLN